MPHLGHAGAQAAVVAPQGPVYHYGHLPLQHCSQHTAAGDATGDLAVREVHGESSEGLTALAEAAGRVLLRQEDLVPEPVRHLDTRREVTETRGNGNDKVVYLYLM